MKHAPRSRSSRRLRTMIGPTVLVLIVGGLLFAVLVFLFAALDFTGVLGD